MACPKCKGDLVLSPSGNWIDCPACRLRFAIEDGIPNMLIDEARPLDAATAKG
jgi:uncharacterized protein YbaR (Trm112 family)